MAWHVDGRTYPHDVDNQAAVYEDEQGRLWVTHEELLACGYRGIEDFDVVYINGKFYELQAYMRIPAAWWIEEVELEEETPEAESEAQEAATGESA